MKATAASNVCGEAELRKAIERFNEQLAWTVNGNFDLPILADCPDDSIQTLKDLINYVLSAVRLGVEDVELKNNETLSRMHAILDAAPDAIFTLDERGYIESFNRAASKIFGYSQEEAVGMDYRRMVPPDRRDEFDEELKQYLAAETRHGMSIQREVVRQQKDGEKFPMEFHLSTIRLADRRIIVVIGHDITSRKQAEANLAAVTQQLVQASRQAGMAELATGVLHNVGNVLNSVNVSTMLLTERIKRSKSERLAEVSQMLQENAGDLAKFFTEDEKGQRLPGYLAKLAEHLTSEKDSILFELADLSKNVEHIKKIIHTQQANAKVFGVVESVALAEVVNDALTINATSFDRYGIQLVREFDDLPLVTIDKQRLLQILVNLVRNAKHAILDGRNHAKQLVVRIKSLASDRVQIDVIDTGVGIMKENLTRIFNHGFTTKKEGHGFGLHSSALAAKELGGTLTAHSDGPERGATFSLVVPVIPWESSGGPTLAQPTTTN
jgi:two-component system, LuxR family, sensor kinase FixL